MRSIIVVILLCGAAGADELAVARDHYVKGTKDYDLGLYDEAVREYMAAYQSKDDPALLYNIAQAHRLAGHESEAVRFYHAYLRKVPRAKNRAEIEEKIAELERTLDQHRRTQTQLPPDHVLTPVEDAPRPDGSAAATPAATAASPATEETAAASGALAVAPSAPVKLAVAARPASAALDLRRARVEERAGLATGISGIAFTAVGAVMLGLAVETADELSRKFDPGLDSSNATYRALAGVFLSVGVAATTAGFVVYAIGRRTAHRARAQVSVGAPALRVVF